jgi:hypothetical protein
MMSPLLASDDFSDLDFLPSSTISPTATESVFVRFICLSRESIALVKARRRACAVEDYWGESGDHLYRLYS